MIRVPPQRGGWLEVVCGPMFSGKSEEMIRRLRRAEIAGQRVLLFKPRIDDRYDAADVVSHAGVRMRAVPVDGVRRDRRARAGLRRGRDRRGAVLRADDRGRGARRSPTRGVRVIAAGLDQDFRRLPFGPMPELLARAEFVDKLQAVCHRCGGPATTTQRLVDGAPAPYSGETIVVGAPSVRGSLPGLPRARRGRDPPDRLSDEAAAHTTNAPAATSTIVPPGGRSP